MEYFTKKVSNSKIKQQRLDIDLLGQTTFDLYLLRSIGLLSLLRKRLSLRSIQRMRRKTKIVMKTQRLKRNHHSIGQTLKCLNINLVHGKTCKTRS
jgi:hypothetical protein